MRRDKRSANDCGSFAFRVFQAQRKDSLQEASKRKWDEMFKNL